MRQLGREAVRKGLNPKTAAGKTVETPSPDRACWKRLIADVRPFAEGDQAGNCRAPFAAGIKNNAPHPGVGAGDRANDKSSPVERAAAAIGRQL